MKTVLVALGATVVCVLAGAAPAAAASTCDPVAVRTDAGAVDAAPYCADASGAQLSLTVVSPPEHGTLSDAFAYTPGAGATYDRIGYAPVEADGSPGPTVWAEIGIKREPRPACRPEDDVRVRTGSSREVYLYCVGATSWTATATADADPAPFSFSVRKTYPNNGALSIWGNRDGSGVVSVVARNADGQPSKPLALPVEIGADVNHAPGCFPTTPRRMRPGQWTWFMPICPDVDGDDVAITLGDDPGLGSFDPLDIAGWGWFYSVPAGTQPQTVTLKATGSDGRASDTYQQVVTIDPDRPNRAPTCLDDTGQTAVSGVAILGGPNCFDMDNDGLRFRLKSADHGTVERVDSYTWEFTPDAGHTGPAGYTLEADDGIATTPFTMTYTVEAPPKPAVQIDDVAATTNDPTPTFTFSSAAVDATFTCQVDDGTPVACTSPFESPKVGEGAHTLRVWATQGGETGDPAQRAWTLDVTPPAAPVIDAGPDRLTTSDDGDALAWFADDADAADYECELDDEQLDGCGDVQNVAVGPHTLIARAVDAAGNRSPATTYSWRRVPEGTTIKPVAAHVPVGLLDADPDAPGGLRVLMPDGGAAGIGAAPGRGVAPNGAAWVGDRLTLYASDTTAARPLELGLGFTKAQLKTYGVTAATLGLLVDDTVVPSCTGAVGAASPDPCIAARETAASGDGRVTLRSSSPVLTLDLLKDTRAPKVTITGAAGSFAFTADEVGATFECSLDAAAFEPCTTAPGVTELAAGKHSLRVRATDATGNVGAVAERSWTVAASAATPTPAAAATATPSPSATSTTTATPAVPRAAESADRTPADLSVTAKRVSLRKAVRRGLPVSPRCSEQCMAIVSVGVDGKTAKRLGLSRAGKRMELGSDFGDGHGTLRITLDDKLTAVRRVRLVVFVLAIDAAGNRSMATTKITLER